MYFLAISGCCDSLKRNKGRLKSGDKQAEVRMIEELKLVEYENEVGNSMNYLNCLGLCRLNQ